MNTRYPAIAPAIMVLMSAREAEFADIPVLQPADPFLDTAGEELRSRIFMTQNERGESLCLRPEFTIPVCRSHIAAGISDARRYCYLGEVFRQRRRGGNEFFQTGIEDLGDPDQAGADARSIGDALAVLRVALPERKFKVTCGDQAVFEAVLAALGLPVGWQKRLTRAFGSRALIEQALHDLAKPHSGFGYQAPVSGLVAAGDETGLAAHIAGLMSEAGLPHKTSRTPDEIARRLIEKTRLTDTRLSVDTMKALRAFLSIRSALGDATAKLRSFGGEYNIEMGEALKRFSARAGTIIAHERTNADFQYDAAFGRPLDYYTGMIFEIYAENGKVPLAGGGRYDRLLTMLGATSPTPGVGFSVWLDRVEAEAGDEP